MTRVFLSSCKNKAFYPEASLKLKKYLLEGNHFDEYFGCCKPGGKDHREITFGADVIVLCHTCHSIAEEHYPANSLTSVFDIILNDPAFIFPNYDGERITLQDCWRVVGRHEIHETVRALLRKMNMVPIELEENRDQSKFCGLSVLSKLPSQVAELAPKRFGEHDPSLFAQHTREEQEYLMKQHVAQITTPRVVSYCFACDGGLQTGGANSVGLLDLLFETE